MTQRRVQLWRFYDSGDEVAPPVPARQLHRSLLKQDSQNADMANVDQYGYETQLQPVPGNRPHFILHRIRDHDLPSQRSKNKIRALDPSINELAEGSHLFLLERNLVVFIGTGFSPRPNRFAEWLRARLGWDVYLQPVLRPDIGAVVENIRKVTRVQIRVNADEARRLDASGFFDREDDPLGALRTAQRFNQGGIIALEYSVGQGEGADQGFFHRLISRLRGADLSYFRSVKADVHLEDSDGVTPIDFINDKIVATVEVDQDGERQRLLSNKAAQTALDIAWTQFTEGDDILSFISRNERPTLQLPAALETPTT